jgi:hypothetical protein
MTRVYTPQTDKFSKMLSTLTGFEVGPEEPGQAQALTLIIRRHKDIGGVDEPCDYITDPAKTIVIAGADNSQGQSFAYKAADQGVPKNNIFLIPRAAGIDLIKIAARLTEMALTLPSEGPSIGAPDIPEPSQPQAITIAVVKYRGGTGSTSVAMSLAIHFADIGDRVAVIDLGSPPAAHRHCSGGGPKETDCGMRVTESFCDIFVPKSFCDIYSPLCPVWELPVDTLTGMINKLKTEYDRLIIDFSAEPLKDHLDAAAPDKVVIVMDPDIEQTVATAAEFKDPAIFVYNRAIPLVSAKIISDLIGTNPVIIPEDAEGCQAALTSREPAYRTSESMATGIGELAAAIGRR